MISQELALLRRKELVGIAALVCWGLGLLIPFLAPCNGLWEFGPFFVLVAAWALTAMWVAIDAHHRRVRHVAWTLLTIVTGPMGFFFYILTRMPVPAMCLVCGTTFPNSLQPCPNCGHYPTVGRATAAIKRTYSGLLFSLTKAPVEQARTTAKHLIAGLIAAALFGLIAGSASHSTSHIGFFGLMVSLSIAGAWVMLAWWVYLDATWRRMDAVPWALLTLITNVVGLVTYLVIRYPEPRACPSCAARLPIGLKRCPYCGAEAELTCPRCQSPVKPDWGYCPACATRLGIVQTPPAQTPGCSAPAALLSVSGTVTDASTSCPIEGAEVRIDSREGGASTLTDAAGRYTLAELAPGPYVLVASLPGYASDAKPYSPTPTGAGPVHFSLYPARPEADPPRSSEKPLAG